MKTVIISPFSRPRQNGEQNAKNYPFWNDVISKLRQFGINTIQVGEIGEKNLGADKIQLGLPFAELTKLVKNTNTWVSIDNFFHHFCVHLQKPGVVIFGKSDPLIFGHEINTNLLKDRRYLRPLQFRYWAHEPHDGCVFVNPDVVFNAIVERLAP